MEGTHSLEGYNARCLGGAEDLQRLCLGGAEGLLDDDVLATGDAGKGLLVVKCVRAADIDGVDIGGCRELVERGKVSLATALGGKGGAAIGITRERAHKRGLVVGIDDLDKVVGDHGCADGRDAQHTSPLRCLVYTNECSAWGHGKRAKTPLEVALVKAGVDIEVAAVGRRGGELIAALVELVTGVTLNPDELNLVLAFGGE